ncbi:hypothetical protein HHK36_001167 [Tetracentron sinense]|uniref:Uncharacterized protein n=1 Tax=Tetracentron sinense TaxID=13715 RepID=A0A834YA56_TETSI|nr:hypothetical protein HHK36_032937 [Tetracentron sinense]KAF8413191.1 hypothetical protein HHK36_001167 [Tetracentron sinense]
MADEENNGEETTSRGTEWEVVSLTASTYAAAPGPKGFESNDDENDNQFDEDEEKNSSAMFMSDHFVFPPSQHENLVSEPGNSEIHNELGDERVIPNEVPRLDVQDGNIFDRKNEENWDIKGLIIPDEFPGIQFIDEKGNEPSVCGTEFERSTTLQVMNLVDKEQSIFSAAKYSSFQGEADISESTICDENTVIPEPTDLSQRGLDSPSDITKSPKHTKEDKYIGSSLPCKAWWKRQATSLYAHAKEGNSFWSVFIAAALMGFVILGQQWQQERWQVQQLRWQFSINDEKMNWMLGSLSRFKDVIVGGHRRGSFIRGGASAER